MEILPAPKEEIAEHVGVAVAAEQQTECPRSGQIDEIFRPKHCRRTDHPVCAISERIHFLGSAATPPFQEGEMDLWIRMQFPQKTPARYMPSCYKNQLVGRLNMLPRMSYEDESNTVCISCFCGAPPSAAI